MKIWILAGLAAWTGINACNVAEPIADEPEAEAAASEALRLGGGHSPPLVIRKQGSFFVNGETKLSGALTGSPAGPLGAGGDSNKGTITVNQMYVQYQLPLGHSHVPVVLVNGCCLTGAAWETTPDGRMGWSEYFVRKQRPVYVAEHVARARSGFDATVINEVRLGLRPPSDLPNLLTASHELAWGLFRLGPSPGVGFPDGQFPVEAAGELFKQLVPDLNQSLPQPNPTVTNLAALSSKLDGAVLVGHSQSGFFPQQAALTSGSKVLGAITIETMCPPLDAAQVENLKKVPVLIVWGDHLTDVPGFGDFAQASFDSCQAVVNQLKAAGGDAMTLSLPSVGVRGNSHNPMHDRNNLEVADLLLNWIDKHVEKRRR
jgi:pimeloyl-ACP methyl ester carboxylesterase